MYVCTAYVILLSFGSVHHPESLVVDEQLLFGVIDDGIQDNQMKDESSERFVQTGMYVRMWLYI